MNYVRMFFKFLLKQKYYIDCKFRIFYFLTKLLEKLCILKVLFYSYRYFYRISDKFYVPLKINNKLNSEWLCKLICDSLRLNIFFQRFYIFIYLML